MWGPELKPQKPQKAGQSHTYLYSQYFWATPRLTGWLARCAEQQTHPQHIILKMNVNITLAVCFLVYRTMLPRNLSPLCVQIKPYLCKTHPKLPSSLRATRFWDEVLSWSRHRCKQRANQTPESRPRSTLSHEEEEKVFGAVLSSLGEGSLLRAQCWGHLNSSANTQQEGSNT